VRSSLIASPAAEPLVACVHDSEVDKHGQELSTKKKFESSFLVWGREWGKLLKTSLSLLFSMPVNPWGTNGITPDECERDPLYR
jgi:hypothetical protein